MMEEGPIKTGPSSNIVGRALIDNGIGVDNDLRLVADGERIAVIVLLTLGIWNGVEMVVLTLLTFKQYRGLYFWSIMVASAGIVLYATGFIINEYHVFGSNIPPGVLSLIGWSGMITGQSLVLYSRLHLISVGERTLRMILYMIVFTVITLCIPIWIVGLGANSDNPDPYLVPYSIYEKVEVSIYFLQELTISLIYVTKAFGFLGRLRGPRKLERGVARIMYHLIAVNIVVICLDISVLITEYLGMFFIQTSWKGVVYGVKLKCEISILNRLVDFVNRSKMPSNFKRSEASKRAWDQTLSAHYSGGEQVPRETSRLSHDHHHELAATLPGQEVTDGVDDIVDHTMSGPMTVP